MACIGLQNPVTFLDCVIALAAPANRVLGTFVDGGFPMQERKEEVKSMSEMLKGMKDFPTSPSTVPIPARNVKEREEAIVAGTFGEVFERGDGG